MPYRLARSSAGNEGQLELAVDARRKLRHALGCRRYSDTSGLTHNFYHYPARFAPTIARQVIETFSLPEDIILDPFMGGGTSVIEALALGRRAIGVDVNALAHFVTEVRTQPLSPNDENEIRKWARRVARSYSNAGSAPLVVSTQIRNLPPAAGAFLSAALDMVETLPLPRQRAFARCALLRLGQWVLDCRDIVAPRRRLLANKLPELVESMLSGLADFVGMCRNAGIAKNAISGKRVVIHRSAAGLQEESVFRREGAKPRLVLTSPPYPSVHILYHRWQFRGRKETSAPYWIANVPDGHYMSYYMGGSRTPTGLRTYFSLIEDAFTSVRSVVDDAAVVAQLVGFSDPRTQLPKYLRAMQNAGFVELKVSANGHRLRRQIPNRKWYAKLQTRINASSEILLLHRPA